MSGLLAQLFVALGVTMTAGIVLGFTLGAHRPRLRDEGRSSPGNTGDEGAEHEGDLDEVVQREAGLIEALARADDDLHARARELAVANEEITCLLEQLHEARRATR